MDAFTAPSRWPSNAARTGPAGTKGPRSYDWALAEVTWPGGAEGGPRRGYHHLLLVRCSITDPTQVAYFAVHAHTGTPISEIVRVMGLRWSIDCFETAKSDCGLDHYEVRTWYAWHRHVTLSMAAPAFLTITDTRTRDLQEPDAPGDLPAPADQVPALKKGDRQGSLKS